MEAGQPSITKPKRPRGITVLSVLGIIGGIFAPIMGLFLMIISPYLANQHNDLGTISILFSAPFHYAFGGFLVVEGVASFIISIGMLRGRKWAWKTSIVLYLIGMTVGSTLSIWSSPNLSNIISSGLGAAIGALIIYYFYRPHVKSYFGIGIPTTGL
ncbi:MAG: hypothetical protein E6K91_03745 [Thaumarchaeota archaeon]|nr:MAG: hypothetical protein E6K91_03745 [Nitrososphaerota archaeon]